MCSLVRFELRRKPLLPSLKEKKRYVAFEVMSEKTLKFEFVTNEIVNEITNYIGKLGYEKMGLIFLKDWSNNKGIARVNNKYVDHLKASFVLIDKTNLKLIDKLQGYLVIYHQKLPKKEPSTG